LSRPRRRGCRAARLLEDTDVERTELEGRFGQGVGDLVAAVSDDPSIADDEARKNELRERVRRIGGYALAVYAADKVSKVRELRYLLTVGLSPDEAEIKHRRHRKSLRMLDDELGETRLVERLRFELEALEALPRMDGRPDRPFRRRARRQLAGNAE
jgi:hypothetical protein